jgi:hypothetical protein
MGYMKAFILSLILFCSLEASQNDWELVVITYNHKTKEETTLVYYFDSYESLKTKMDFIAKTHRPKGSVRKLLYRERIDGNRFYVITVKGRRQ